MPRNVGGGRKSEEIARHAAADAEHERRAIRAGRQHSLQNGFDGRESLARFAQRKCKNAERSTDRASQPIGNPTHVRLGIAEENPRRRALAHERSDLRLQTVADRDGIAEIVVDVWLEAPDGAQISIFFLCSHAMMLSTTCAVER